MYRDVAIPPWPNYTWPSQEINRPHRMKVHEKQPEMEWEDWAESLRFYYAFTTMIDDQIKRIVDHLEAKGLADNTLIIFTSDHGETLGSHGGLVDKGWHHFEETHRIGMIIKDPSRPGGQVRTEWASNLDVYPTILDAAGAEYDPAQIHGRSLMPLVAGETVDWRDTAVTEFGGVNSVATSMVTLRHGDLKYGWNAGNLDELYDLSADPHETTDRSEDPAYADRLHDMRRRMYTFMVETRCPYLGVYARDALKIPVNEARSRRDLLTPVKL
jgi:arylsulfatase A-like enzyme